MMALGLGLGLPFGGSAGPSGPTEFTPIAGSYNFLRANNAKILAAMTATKANTADTIIAMMGDSTQFGQNSKNTETTNAKTKSASQQLSDLLQTAGIPSSCDSFWGSGEAGISDGGGSVLAALLLADPKLTKTGTGWDFNSFVCVGGNTFGTSASDTTSTLTYTTAKSCNKVDVYFLKFSGGGNFKYAVDGGAESANVSTDTAGARTMGMVTLDLGASATHAVKFRITDNNVFFIGWRFHDTNTRRVIVDNQGACGWQTSDWLATTAGESPGNQFASTGAHLAIMQAGLVNDRGNHADPTASVANLQTMITGYAAANCTPWLFNPEPVADATDVSFAYQAAILAKSNSANVTFLDILSDYTTLTAWVAAGFGNGTDTNHPIEAGYGYIAAREAAPIQAVWAAA